MARRRRFGAVVVATVVWSVTGWVPAHAAGGYTAVYGAGNPLHPLGSDYNVSTYVAADFDGDGDADVAAREPTSDASIDYFRNDGGTFVGLGGAANPFAGISFAAGPANFLNTRVLTGDFDRDGDVDLWHHGVGFTAFYRNDGASFSAHSGAADPLSGLAAHDPGTYVVADVDGDSDPDVVAREPTADASIELFRNDGGAFTRTVGPFGGVSFAPDPGNFLGPCVLVLDADDDGDLDLWHEGVGFTALYRNDGATFTTHTGIDDPLQELASYDAHGYVAVDADTDGDTDVVAREPTADMTVDVLRNDGGMFTRLTGAASPFAAVTLATSDFIRVHLLTGDLDGDGDADLYNQALNELYRQSGSAPVAGARTPVRGATGATVAGALTLSFSEPVTLGSGAVVLRNATTGSVIERLGVASAAAQFSGAGTATITIRPTAALPFATTVTVTVEPGAFVATVDGDAFAGVEPVAWRFTTAADTAPALTGLDSDTVTHTEGDEATVLDAAGDAAVVDADGVGFGGGTLEASITAGAVAGEDRLTVDPGPLGTATSTPTGFTVALSPAAGAGSLGALVRSITYVNDAGDAPTTGPRTVVVTVADPGGLTATAVVTVAVVAVNDAPTLGVPPALTSGAGTSLVLDNLVVGDADDARGTLELRMAADIGTFGGGSVALVRTGTLGELRAAIAQPSIRWRAPERASHGALHVTLDDDGGARATGTIELTVTAAPGATGGAGTGGTGPGWPAGPSATPAGPRPLLALAVPDAPRYGPLAPAPTPAHPPAHPSAQGSAARGAPGSARHATPGPAAARASAPHDGRIPWATLLLLLVAAVVIVVAVRDRRRSDRVDRHTERRRA